MHISSSTSMQQTEVILFDMGGVLVEFVGVSRLIEWTSGTLSVDELWRRWLASPSVRAFESGRGSAEEFAQAIVRELELPITPAAFIAEFAAWLTRVYDGAEELLTALKPHYR